jgi:DNA (cytosine-5)-methyltransferase 1
MGGLGTGFNSPDVMVDHNKDCCNTYGMNHEKTTIRCMDVSKYLENCLYHDFDVLISSTSSTVLGMIGGVPCQPHSVMNRNKTNAINIDRANQMQVFIEGVKVIKPYFVLIENVASIAKSYKEYAIKELKSLGYNVVSKVISSYSFGSVQKRPRWFITACKTRHVFPQPILNTRTAKEILINTMDCEFSPKDYILQALQDETLETGKWIALPHQRYKAYFIIDPDKPLPAVVNASKLRYVHPSRKRYLNIRELLMAQGFPIDYKIAGTLSSKSQQIANAVPVEVARSFYCEFVSKLNLC